MVVHFLEVSAATKDTRESSICQSEILKFTRMRTHYIYFTAKNGRFSQCVSAEVPKNDDRKADMEGLLIGCLRWKIMLRIELPVP